MFINLHGPKIKSTGVKAVELEHWASFMIRHRGARGEENIHDPQDPLHEWDRVSKIYESSRFNDRSIRPLDPP